jgi:hypothetical protein
MHDPATAWQLLLDPSNFLVHLPAKQSGTDMHTQSCVVWYFVVHLEEQDRPTTAMQFQIQVLNEHGQSTACGYLDDQSTSMSIGDHAIPLLVIQAARRQPIGEGEYVNELGETVPAF